MNSKKIPCWIIPIALLLTINCSVFAQVRQDSHGGIHFETGKTWDQVLAKAKSEKKYIFVDCYATWCGPCKMMDRDIYPKDSVGNYMNSRYVSVKVQMDKTTMDDSI